MGRWATAINPGKPLPDRPTPTEIRHFLSKVKVEQRLPLNHAVKGPCWIWKAMKDPRGYGGFSWRRIKVWVHRFAYECFRGEIPEGLEVNHECFQQDCVNPAHLSLMTPPKNRGNKKAAQVEPELEPAPF